ncbi:MAG: cation transporter [Magnetococcales bacterium]|nr:cation transporter [Magnetococcales bacterium]
MSRGAEGATIPSSCACGCGETRAADLRQARRLEYLSLGWVCIEAGVGIAAGVTADSTALIGFGVDSLIEMAAAMILLWRLTPGAGGERRERLALRLVGASFLLLALYVGSEAVIDLTRRTPPEASPVGILLAVAALIVMPLLARAKRRLAARLRSGALAADSRQSALCAYLSAILLGGLVLNALLGWWWADPVAALVMVPIIAHEGVQALRGNSCAGCC